MNQEDYHIEQLQDDQSMLLEELEKIKIEMKEVMRSWYFAIFILFSILYLFSVYDI